MNKKHKKVCRALSDIDHSLIIFSTITGWVFISTFASLVGIRIGTTSSWKWIKNLRRNCRNQKV